MNRGQTVRWLIQAHRPVGCECDWRLCELHCERRWRVLWTDEWLDVLYCQMCGWGRSSLGNQWRGNQFVNYCLACVSESSCKITYFLYDSFRAPGALQACSILHATVPLWYHSWSQRYQQKHSVKRGREVRSNNRPMSANVLTSITPAEDCSSSSHGMYAC